MKKITALALILTFVICVFSACGNNEDNNGNTNGTQTTESQAPADNNEVDDGVNDVVDGAKDEVKDTAEDVKDTADDVKNKAEDVKDKAEEKIDDVKENPKGESQNSLPEVSENTKVVKDNKAPKIYIIDGADSTVDSITYHLKDCSVCKDKNISEIPWEMAKTIGFWQCPECNPPRYEGYKNAK